MQQTELTAKPVADFIAFEQVIALSDLFLIEEKLNEIQKGIWRMCLNDNNSTNLGQAHNIINGQARLMLKDLKEGNEKTKKILYEKVKEAVQKIH